MFNICKRSEYLLCVSTLSRVACSCPEEIERALLIGVLVNVGTGEDLNIQTGRVGARYCGL